MSELTDYLADLPEPQRSAIEQVYARARKLVPDAVDGVSYGMPALRYRGKALLSVMNARDHIGLYPFSPAAIDGVRGDLEGFSLAKGTVRFTADHPIPEPVLDRLILARAEQIDA
ncbi:MAG: DUF1801 domain-containing protein [Propionicimonas sp.]|nr:DUF1801 domain-containing protein [Propionicimonas sp.]